MADISLLFDVAGGGSLNGESGSLINSQLTSIVNAINATPLKIKFQADQSSLDTIRSQIQTITNNIGTAGAAVSVRTDRGSIKEIANQTKMLEAGTREYGNALSQVNNLLAKLKANAANWTAASTGESNAEYEALQRQITALTELEAQLKTGKLSATDFSTALANIRGAADDASEAIKSVGENQAAIGILTSDTEAYATALGKVSNMYTTIQVNLRNWTAAQTSEASSANYIVLQEQAAALLSLRERLETGTLSAEEFSAALSQISLRATEASNAIKLAGDNKMAASMKMLTDGTREYGNALAKIERALSQVTTAQNNWTAARRGTSHESYDNLEKYKQRLLELQAELETTGMSEEEFRTRFSKITSEIAVDSAKIKAAGENVQSLGHRFASLTKSLSTWFSSMQLVLYAVRVLRDMISATIELDSAMTQLQIVTRASAEEMERFGDKAAESAKKVASTITDLVDSATTYARLGYSMDESNILAQYTAMLQNVGDIDVSDAQDAITAIIKAYDDIDINNIESVMDKLVTTGNNFPISVSQIAEGMNNASSSLAAAGNTFEQSVALLTAANTTIQNAAKSSTGLRTIAARIRNTKAELDELGEEMTSAKYEEVVQMLTDHNVALVDLNGEYRSTYDIMCDIAKQWDKMTSMEQAAMATELAGTRQQAVFYSIIEQFQEASGAMDAMASSAGALDEAYSKYLDSAQAHINQFKAAWQEFSSNFVNAGFVSGVVDLGTLLVGVLNTIAKLINALGGLKTVLWATAAIIITIKAEVIGAALIGAVTKFATMLTGLVSTIQKVGAALKVFIAMTKASKNASAGAMVVYGQSSGVLGRLSAAFNAVGISASTAQIAVGAFMIVLTALVIAMQKVKQAQEEAAAKAKEIRDKNIESANAAATLSDEISDLVDRYTELSSAMITNDSQRTQLIQTQNELIEKLGIEQDELDKLIKKYGTYTDAIRAAAVEKLKENERGLRGGINSQKENLLEAAKVEYQTGVMGTSASIPLSNLVGIWGTVSKNITEGTNELKAIEALSKDSMFRASATNKLFTFGIEGMTIDDLNSVDGILEAYDKLGKALDVVSNAAGSDNEIYSALYAQYNKVKSAVDEYHNSIGKLNTNLAEQYMQNSLIGKEIPKTKAEFEAYRQEVIDAATSSGEFIGSTNEITSAVDGVLSKQVQFSKFYDDVGTSSGSAGVQLHDLSESLQELKTSYDLVATASKEMADGGGLSPDTIKALADATDNYIDFLYEENGVIKLNTEAWKAYSEQKMRDDMANIEKEIEALREQRTQLEENLATAEALDGRYRSKNEKVQEATDALEANTRAIEENEAKLGIYSTLFNDITGSLDAYSSALNNFTNVSNAITSVSDALTTVADLQEAVADGFTMSVDKALEFAKVYPEILNGATVAANGQLSLNKDVVNSFIEGKEAELKAQIDAEIAKLESDKAVLTAKMNFAQAELELAKNVGEGEGQISLELAQYRINAGNAAAQAMIENGIDEATAYQLAMAAMAQNSEEFDRIAAEVCTDVDGNFNQAAFSAAQGVYNNMKNIATNLDGVITAAHQAAQAIAGIASGTQAGSTGTFSGSGGSSGSKANISLSHGTFNGVDYTYSPKTVSLDQFISDLELDISSYSKAISQIDGQIATLKALRNTSLNKFSTSNKKGSSGSGKGGSGSDKSSKNDEESWFEKQYKLHKHLLAMDAEEVDDYLDWLNTAYKKAYKEGIITIDDYYKYQEEVYKGLQDLFKDYLSDVEHEISMRSNYKADTKKVISLYQGLIKDVEKEIAAARAQGLTDEDDYIQELQKKWWSYKDAIKDIKDDIKEAAKDALDDLIDYRIDMLKQDIKNEKDALDKKLDNLKEFYDKQKKMLQDAYDEEKYLEDQKEKRKSVSDIQAELAQLQYDDSAWAQKRKLQLQQELADAEKDLNDFEKEHALQEALDAIDNAYNSQEAQIKAEMDALDEKLNDPQALFNQALQDIKNNSKNQLYYQMLMYNRQYGDGKDETVKELWEKAFGALDDYQQLFGKDYKGVKLENETGYKRDESSWDDAKVSGTNPNNNKSSGSNSSSKKTETKKDDTPKLTDAIKRKVAAAIWNGTMGWGKNPDREKRLTEVFGKNNGIQALVNKGIGKNDAKPSSDYTYRNMRKKFKGYASGTKNAVPGFAQFDEQGTEYIFTSGNGEKFRMFSSGDKVLNAKATDFLYNFANGSGEILEKIIRSALGGGILDKISPIVYNNEINMGDITVQGNADNRTVSEIRRAQRGEVEFMLKSLQKLNK